MMPGMFIMSCMSIMCCVSMLLLMAFRLIDRLAVRMMVV
jgi:hypothetical protein